MNDANTKVEVNTNPLNSKLAFDVPLFAMPGIFGGIAEQGVVRAKESCEKMKAASGEIADILGKAYSTNTKGAADYGAKVIEISGANATSAIGGRAAVSHAEPQELRSRVRAEQGTLGARSESRDRDCRADQEPLHQSPAESRLTRTFAGRRDRLEQAPPARRGASPADGERTCGCGRKAKQGGNPRWASS